MRRTFRGQHRYRIGSTTPAPCVPSGRLRRHTTVARCRAPGARAVDSGGAHKSGQLGHACGGWGLITLTLLVLVIIDDIIVGNLIDRLRRRDVLGAAHYVRDIARQLWAVWLLLGTAVLAATIILRMLARLPHE